MMLIQLHDPYLMKNPLNSTFNEKFCTCDLLNGKSATTEKSAA